MTKPITVCAKRPGFKRSHGRRSLEGEKGIALVEMMVAVLVVSVLMTAVIDALMLSRRSATYMQNQLIAANIAQEVCDAARNQTYATLVAAKGSYTLTDGYINGSGGAGGVPFISRPLVLNPTTLNYSPQTWQNGQGKNVFHGQATVTISDMAVNPPALQVQVTVSWPEGGSQLRTITQSTVISQNGIHTF